MRRTCLHDFLCFQKEIDSVPKWAVVERVRHHISLHLFLYLCAFIVNPDEQRFCCSSCTLEGTMENTDLSLERLLFITALEIAYSCLFDNCADVDWYGRSERCEGRPLSLPLYLFLLLSAKRKSQPDLPIVASPPHKGWCDCGAFQRAETRALSEDPLFLLLSAFLSSLLFHWKPVSSGVRWGKDLFVSAPFWALLATSFARPPSLIDFLFQFRNSPVW